MKERMRYAFDYVMFELTRIVWMWRDARIAMTAAWEAA